MRTFNFFLLTFLISVLLAAIVTSDPLLHQDDGEPVLQRRGHGPKELEKANGCHPRYLGGDSQVCVCSATDKCDNELAHANHISTDKGHVTSFVSTKAGARFDKHHYQFVGQNTAVRAHLEVDIDRAQKHQTIIGFGGAFTDSAGYEIIKLPHDLQNRLIKDYFGPDGIEYRLGRVTIGGSDFSTRAYSLDDYDPDEDLSTFALQKEDFDYKLPFMRLAKEVSKHPLKYFGSAWSPPVWMKTNHQLNHGGFLRGHAGEKYYKAFAMYTRRFLEEYKKNKVDIWGLTVVNEPGVCRNPNWPWNCLGFTAETQRDYIKLDLGPELHAHGFSHVAVMHFDHNVDEVTEYANAILGDPDSAKYVAGTAFHWYDRNSNRSILNGIAKRWPNKILLSTEACLYQKRKIGDWNNFNDYADDIIRVLNEGVQGWVDWNMVLDMNGGPSWAHNKVYAPIQISDNGREYYKLPIYYAMGHFSKFIVPDSVRLTTHHKHNASGNKVLITVFERPDNTTVLTVLNKNDHKIGLKVHDPAHGYLVVNLEASSMHSMIWH